MNKEYFASMNTSNGFCSYFNEIFSPDRLEAVYIIKGGSGTGKSTMMKRIAEHFEKDGLEAERFYCSSDKDSLDGIIIDKRVAVLDGTAPHTTDPKYPGAVEEIVNLSGCWNTERLKESKKEIISLVSKKNASYSKGYSFLSAAGKLSYEIRKITSEKIKTDKMQQAIHRFFKQGGFKGAGNKTSVRLTSVICAEGRFRLHSFEDESDKICLVTKTHGCAGVFFKEFLDASSTYNLERVISYDPVCPDEINAIYFPEIRLCVVTAEGSEDVYDEKYKVFNLERFIDKDVLCENRAKLRFANKCLNALIDGAVDSFVDAKNYHEKIEEIYTSCVDFKTVRRITELLINNITDIIH